MRFRVGVDTEAGRVREIESVEEAKDREPEIDFTRITVLLFLLMTTVFGIRNARKGNTSIHKTTYAYPYKLWDVKRHTKVYY